jgi:hypothetical protein
LVTQSQGNDDNWEGDENPPAKEGILLVYIFQGREAIEKAAQGLFLYEESQCMSPKECICDSR